MDEVPHQPRRVGLLQRHHLAVMLVAVAVVALAIWGRESYRSNSETLAAGRTPERGTDVTSVSSPPEATEVKEVAEQPAMPETVPADTQRQLLLGSWSDEFYGKRVFTFAEDGTAVMTLELDSVGRMLYGPKLTFFIAWELKDGILNLQMTGGEPDGSAVALAKLFGEKSEQRIEHLAADEMRLRSLDSQKLYVHRRIQATETPGE